MPLNKETFNDSHYTASVFTIVHMSFLNKVERSQPQMYEFCIDTKMNVCM